MCAVTHIEANERGTIEHQNNRLRKSNAELVAACKAVRQAFNELPGLSVKADDLAAMIAFDGVRAQMNTAIENASAIKPIKTCC